MAYHLPEEPTTTATAAANKGAATTALATVGEQGQQQGHHGGHTCQQQAGGEQIGQQASAAAHHKRAELVAKNTANDRADHHHAKEQKDGQPFQICLVCMAGLLRRWWQSFACNPGAHLVNRRQNAACVIVLAKVRGHLLVNDACCHQIRNGAF